MSPLNPLKTTKIKFNFPNRFKKFQFEEIKKKAYFRYLSIFLILILLTLAISALYLYQDKFEVRKEEERKISLTTTPAEIQPSPTPTLKPLPSGRQIYILSHGKDVKGPKINKVVIDPLDPKVGKSQKVTVTIKYPEPVVSAKATLKTDNKESPHLLTKISGGGEESVWEGSWIVDDSYNYNYYLFFEITSTVDSYKGGLTFR